MALACGSQYRPELDGIRAIAILMVITCHMHAQVWTWLSGQRGVTIFFVVSGYLITALALAEESANGRVALSAFYIRRAFRILPLYYFILAVYAILIFGTHWWTAKAGPFAAALPYLLFYLQELPFFRAGHTGMPFYQSWSLGIEEKFYLAWPFLCFVLLRFQPLARLVVATLLIIIFPLLGGLFAPYAPIMIGCIIALVCAHQRARDWITSHPAQANVAVWMGLLGIVAMHVFARHQHPGLEVAYSLVVGVFLVSLLYATSTVKKLLSGRALVFIGKRSYGMYLVHLLCIDAIEHFVHLPVAAYAVSTIASLLTAAALYRLIERPLIFRGRQLAERYSARSLSNSRSFPYGQRA